MKLVVNDKTRYSIVPVAYKRSKKISYGTRWYFLDPVIHFQRVQCQSPVLPYMWEDSYSINIWDCTSYWGNLLYCRQRKVTLHMKMFYCDFSLSRKFLFWDFTVSVLILTFLTYFSKVMEYCVILIDLFSNIAYLKRECKGILCYRLKIISSSQHFVTLNRICTDRRI